MNTLTNREMEIADLMAWGCSTEEAADKLNISPFTVKNTLRKIYEKLGFNKVNELCAYVFCQKYGVDIANDRIGNVKRAVLSVSMLCILVFHIFTLNDDIFRARRTRVRRNEVELIFDEEQ